MTDQRLNLLTPILIIALIVSGLGHWWQAARIKEIEFEKAKRDVYWGERAIQQSNIIQMLGRRIREMEDRTP